MHSTTPAACRQIGPAKQAEGRLEEIGQLDAQFIPHRLLWVSQKWQYKQKLGHIVFNFTPLLLLRPLWENKGLGKHKEMAPITFLMHLREGRVDNDDDDEEKPIQVISITTETSDHCRPVIKTFYVYLCND